MSVAASGYLRIETSDVDAWMDFGTSVLGLMDADREDTQGARFLRMDDHPFRFMIEPGGGERLIAAGLEFPDAGAWQATCDAITAAGHEVTRRVEVGPHVVRRLDVLCVDAVLGLALDVLDLERWIVGPERGVLVERL